MTGWPGGRRSGGGALTERLEGFVSVLLHVQLGRDRSEDAAVLVDHERRSLVRQRPGTLDAERLRHALVGVGEKPIVEVVLGTELLLLVDGVSADAQTDR